MSVQSAEVQSWADIGSRFQGAAILIGNGLSLVVDEAFAYDSIVAVAQSDERTNPLTPSDVDYLNRLGTASIEELLRTLDFAARICADAGYDPAPIAERYGRVRQALIEAVQAVHPRHTDVPPSRLKWTRRCLSSYGKVFTTNYDLLLYWSLLSEIPHDDFKDFYWNPGLTFESTNAVISPEAIPVYYIHGALHLFHRPDGKTVKATGNPGSSWGGYTPLLDLTFDYAGSKYPLFVSEGTHQAKVAAIAGNEYLAFAFGSFVHCSDSIVIFGHSLSTVDRHITDAIKATAKELKRNGGRLSLGISVMPPLDPEKFARADALKRTFSDADVVLFDATTHPLGLRQENVDVIIGP